MSPVIAPNPTHDKWGHLKNVLHVGSTSPEKLLGGTSDLGE